MTRAAPTGRRYLLSVLLPPAVAIAGFQPSASNALEYSPPVGRAHSFGSRPYVPPVLPHWRVYPYRYPYLRYRGYATPYRPYPAPMGRTPPARQVIPGPQATERGPGPDVSPPRESKPAQAREAAACQSTLEAQRARITDQQAVISRLRAKLTEIEQSLRLENASLGETLELERATAAKQQGEIDRLRDRLAELENVEQTLADARATAATLRSRLTGLETSQRQENAKLNLALQAAQSALQDKDAQISRLSARLDEQLDLEQALTEAQARNATLEQTLANAREAGATARTRLTELDRSLRQENAELNLALQNAQGALEEKEAQIGRLSARLEESKGLEAALTEARNKNASLAQTLEDTRATGATLRTRMTESERALRQENAKLSLALEEAHTRLDQRNAQISELEAGRAHSADPADCAERGASLEREAGAEAPRAGTEPAP
jgi:chromosome segregation ATPase